jgi:hypothetical protein
MHPRHLVAHPNGRLLHVVMKSGNEVLEIELDSSGLPVKELGNWSTLPDSKSYLASQIYPQRPEVEYVGWKSLSILNYLGRFYDCELLVCGD